MKAINAIGFDTLTKLRITFQGGKPHRNPGNEEPLRSELYSADQMDSHGQVLALSHKVLARRPKDKLLKRLDSNEKVLSEVRSILEESLRAGKNITPAAEWLLDNFYLMEEQIVLARTHLPKGYSECLPYLAQGVSSGMPRVYDIVLEIISHSDGRLDMKGLTSFIQAYQNLTPLTLGELWAIPIMVRLGVIENLRRVSRKVVLDMIDHNLADFWADKMISTVVKEPGNLILSIADMAKSKPPLSCPFVANLIRLLQGKGPALALPLSWMEQQLSAQGLSSNDLVQSDSQNQAADQVSVRNSLGTLRFLDATNWKDFVENLSHVDQILRQDPAGVYPFMDFATRDRYRHVIESLAKTSQFSEPQVAQCVLDLAAPSSPTGIKISKLNHVGYYLVDQGLAQISKKTHSLLSWRTAISTGSKHLSVHLYLLSIVFLSLLATTGMLFFGYSQGLRGGTVMTLLGVLALVGSSQWAVSFVNWLATILIAPALLPRMDFSGGIPAQYKTLVIVPTMLSSQAYIELQIEALEIRFLANRSRHLHFGLLTDFIDADQLTLPEDQVLMDLAQTRIEELNQKYEQEDQVNFFLFHRPRVWNSREKKWMGYERKRGKLSALNAFLRGRGKNDFSLISGDTSELEHVKYVITLDSDTQLPRESAWKFIATMAHPLNQAVYSEKKRRVIEGYGILQPRVSPGIPKSASSRYLQMQDNQVGIDPYTKVSSNVYQDLFGEGSFIGKGIYDVDIFEQTLSRVFPENRILSHDLLEGCYCRCGLLSDVVLYEDSPISFDSDIKRYHRWIRGDWQIGSWILPWVPTGKGKMVSNKLTLLSYWKIFDNLRRSLIPLSLGLLLVLSWVALPVHLFWTLVVAGILLLPAITTAVWELVNKPVEMDLRSHSQEILISLRGVGLRFLFTIATLPHTAWKYTDAILKTLWRMIFTHKKLLEWRASAEVSAKGPRGLGHTYLAMGFGPALALGVTALMITLGLESLFIAAPVLLLWILGPGVSWYLSQPTKEVAPKLSGVQARFLNQVARKTWSFFEAFVKEEDNWLPPDNFQKEPVAVIAHRTSPTNMGLALLANLTAYDFGYIGGNELLQRCHNTLESMKGLQSYQGHLFNWYNTLSKEPLQPRYISTVDSGNLAGHLLVLRQGLLDLSLQPVARAVLFQALRTTLTLVQDNEKGNTFKTVEEALTFIDNIDGIPESLSSYKVCLDQLENFSNEFTRNQGTRDSEPSPWVEAFTAQVRNFKSELLAWVPWINAWPAPEIFSQSLPLEEIPNLVTLSEMALKWASTLDSLESEELTDKDSLWIQQFRSDLIKGSEAAQQKLKWIENLSLWCEELSNVEYDFLYDKSSSLLSIGFNVDKQKLDKGFYDLLASEARLAIFVAISQGKIPQESWFALGRLLANSLGDPILMSWSGSMFEYLMPQLIMPTFENTLLHQTNRATVKKQIEYAGLRGIPWGISESGYNMVDANHNYQYKAFGVPGLGLKRGLDEDLVVAPYASMLALMVTPLRACANLQTLSEMGMEGEYGFYEALDFTPSRLPRGLNQRVVASFMAHHQGMGLLSLSYLLLNKPMQKRFITERRFSATILLLQERIPRAGGFFTTPEESSQSFARVADIQIRRITTPHTRIPEVQLLSNGRYQVMLTNSGGGYSRWKDLAITRWRADTTRDNWGTFCYIKDVQSGKFWSNTHHPTRVPTKDFEAVFSQGHGEFRRNDHGINTKTEIVISPEDDIELRRIRITNKSLVTRVIELTSYSEVVLANQASDEAHPAFSNLFVQTEIVPENQALICTRRPRSDTELPPWMFHLMAIYGATLEAISYETDRMEFIGRGGDLSHPQAMNHPTLSGNQGAVLDPIVSIRLRIRLKPNQSASVNMIYGITDTRENCEFMIQKYRDKNMQNRAFTLSWTHAQVHLRQIQATEAEAQCFNRLAGSILFPNSAFRTEPATVQSNFRGQSGLWSHSVSGDLPVVLLHISEPEGLGLVAQMVKAHAYWRLLGLAVDLVIWNENHGTYRHALMENILGLIAAENTNHTGHSKPGQIFVKALDQLSLEDKILFKSVARVIIQDKNGTFEEQINQVFIENIWPPHLEIKPVPFQEPATALTLPDNLLFMNGIGGFSSDGKEYKVLTDEKSKTPAPWVNVIANPLFGTVVSESGSAYTWAVNAHEYRLTPWSNDPVSDSGGEAFYLRDEVTGHFWSPCPFPTPGKTPYITTHGFGYTTFEHHEEGIHSLMTVFVDKDHPVKFATLRVKNTSKRERKISITGYIEAILGDLGHKTNLFIVSELDQKTGALLIQNHYNTAFSQRTTFFKATGGPLSFTTDRHEFIGRNRDLKDPAALSRKKLSGRHGACMDPCAAFQMKLELYEGTEKDVIFQLGNEENKEAARNLIRRYETTESVAGALKSVREFWNETLGVVRIQTPDTALNTLVNGWLTYQTLACRIFARSGFYQSGGAFGFRDQLQDVLALLPTKPLFARQQILLSASRQFIEGDVQHWWHPPEGRGVRTLCSDDLLWLPYTVARYIEATGENQVLGESVGFLESRPLGPGEASLYDLPITGNLSGTLYEHCVRAIKRSLKKGSHGLPLMGSGDWNDGMDQVGVQGRGESVWLAFFLYHVLTKFSVVAQDSNDRTFSILCTQEAQKLKTQIEAKAWDGQWYKRAWFDDGTPLGSHTNQECRIDAIAQSWSVLSGAGDPHRQAKAMESLDKNLVNRRLGLIQLLDPPFDSPNLNPGYIKGYVPGVRENGGQYSHAAIWALMAFAKLGDRAKVWELFNMIQPIQHSSTPEKIQIYKVEPYVMAADVYANPSHEGRGGWTWYTGSAGWMHQFILSSLIGVKLQNNHLVFKPCFPMDWPSVSISYQWGGAAYEISLFQKASAEHSWWEENGVRNPGNLLPLVDDGKTHLCEVHA